MRDKPAKPGLMTKIMSKVIGQRKTVCGVPTVNGFYHDGKYYGESPTSEDVRCYQIREAVREGRLDPSVGHRMLCNDEWLR